MESFGCFAQDIAGWAENDRGVSFIFGPDVVSTFLQILGGNFKVAYNQLIEELLREIPTLRKQEMDLVCRAHQAACLELFLTS